MDNRPSTVFSVNNKPLTPRILLPALPYVVPKSLLEVAIDYEQSPAKLLNPHLLLPQIETLVGIENKVPLLSLLPPYARVRTVKAQPKLTKQEVAHAAMYTYMRRHNWEDILSSLLSVIVLEQPVATDVDAFLLAKLEYLLAHKELPIRWDMFITSTCAQHNRILPYWLLEQEQDDSIPTIEMFERSYHYNNYRLLQPMFYAWMRFRREQRRIKMDFLVHMQLSENVEKVKLFRMVFKAWLGLTKQGQGVRRVQLSLIQERMQEKLKARGFKAWLHYVTAVRKASNWFKEQQDLQDCAVGEGLDNFAQEDDQMSSLLKYDLRVNIMSFLPLDDIFRVSLVCRSWHQIVQDPRLWAYIDFSAVGKLISDTMVENIINRFRLFVIHVDISNRSYLPDGGRITNRAFACLGKCQNLQSIRSSLCSKISDKGVQAGLVLAEGLAVLDLSGCSVSDLAMKIIAQTCISLEQLKMAGCPGLTEVSIENLTSASGATKITLLDLSSCNALTNRAVALITNHCPRLLDVNFSGLFQIGDEAVKAIAKNCPRLTTVNLSGCSGISGSGFDCLAACTDLTVLDLSDSNLNTPGLLAIFKGLTKVSILKVSYCNFLADDFMAVIGRCPLKELCITHVTTVNDQGLRMFTASPSASLLTTLNLSFCSNFSNAGFHCVLKACHSLASVSVRGCYNLTDDCISQLMVMETLLYLDIAGLPNITDLALLALNGLPYGRTSNLKHLDISECSDITDAGLVCMSYLPALRFLAMAEARGITDSAIACVAYGCKNLQSLDLHGCVQLTDTSAVAIASGCQDLRFLDLSGALHSISDKAVDVLSAKCLKLKYLHLSYHSQVTQGGVLRMKKKNRAVTCTLENDD